MALPREEVATGLPAEMESFAVLVRGLDGTELASPSRCAGWTAGDVAAHVIGQLADVVGGRFDGLGTPEVTARQVEERRGRTGPALADELDEARSGAAGLLAVFDDAAWAGPSPAGGGTLGDGVEALWFDASLHADDIRVALGRPRDMATGLRPSASHLATVLTEQGYRPSTLALDGLPEFPISGGGTAIGGDPVTFVLVATGRADPGLLGLDETVNVYR